ncbi:MAG: FHA domain-containing protein [Fimbriimonadaceae bacterium]
MDVNRTQAMSADPNRTQMGGPPIVASSVSINTTVTIQPVQCPVCKTFNPAGLAFCSDCGLIFDRALPAEVFGAPAVQLPCLVDSSGREHVIRPGDNVIGREGDILTADPRTSRRHAKISLHDGVMQLTDLGSTNGTTVNGESLPANQPRSVVEGDTLGFGGYEMRVAWPGKADATAAIPSNRTATIPSNRTAAMVAPPVAKPVAHLVSGDQRFPLRLGSQTLGRKSDNDISLPDPYISGRHLTLEVSEDSVAVIDVGSTNGTLIDGVKLVKDVLTTLTPESVIQIGERTLTVEWPNKEAGRG